MIQLTLDNVKDFLKNKNYPVVYQKESDQLHYSFKLEGYPSPFEVFLGIKSNGDLLQMVVFICRYKPATHGELAKLLHTINKEVDIPGFGIEEKQQLVFYRCMIPAFNKELEEELIEMFVRSLPLITESFAPIIAVAADGAATYDQIMQKMQDHGKQ